MIRFTVHGEAATAGSKKAFAFRRKDGSLGATVVDANKNTKLWQAQVAEAAAAANPGGLLLAGPLALVVTFYRPRPGGHYRKGKKIKERTELRPDAPPYPHGRPDALKLGRAVEDALTGILWADDAQGVDVTFRKRYGEPARAEIEIAEMGEVPPQDGEPVWLESALDSQTDRMDCR